MSVLWNDQSLDSIENLARMMNQSLIAAPPSSSERSEEIHDPDCLRPEVFILMTSFTPNSFQGIAPSFPGGNLYLKV